MKLITKNIHSNLLALFALMVMITVMFIPGCGSDTVTPTVIPNPNVKSYDSVYIEETIDGTSLSGIDLLNGVTTLRDNTAKDCQLIDSAGTGVNFYLRSGDLSLLNLPVGHQTRFYRFYGDLTAAQFDTISVMPVGRDTINPVLDFTEDDTYGKGSWGYFNVPMVKFPVYGVWLKGKHDDGTTPFNVYALVQPREMTDSTPGVIGGTRMSFRVRINTKGQNDFRKTISQ